MDLILIKKRATQTGSPLFVMSVHFRYHFWATQKAYHVRKIVKILFASFDSKNYRLYEEYESIIDANGEVDSANHIARGAYEKHLVDHTFSADSWSL